MSQQDRDQMDQFQRFQFDGMKQELGRIAMPPMGPQHQQHQHQQHQQHQHGPMVLLSPAAQTAAINGPIAGKMGLDWSAEFQTGPLHQLPLSQGLMAQGQPISQGQPLSQGYYQPRYRPMMNMAMGFPMSQQALQQAPQQTQQQPAESTAVDWDSQFKEVERSQSPEIQVDDKYQATFQEVWDNLQDDALENDFISQQYEDFKASKREPLPADMAQWQKDFDKYVSTRLQFGDYVFEKKERNQFLDMDQDPYEIGLQLMENGAKLSEAALAFEAAIQMNENHVDAWLKLGEVQTQNEKEIAGITALEKCLELNSENSEALMTLAISYINEGYDNAAFATLERWISTKYPQLTEKATAQNPKILDEDRYSLSKRVTELFIKAAQLSPDHASMDPDVQLGLGVLFYANEDFDKTIDCFRAALSIKPDDPVMWNRLGASLANSNRPEEAVEAYFKALEIKPTFVKARYNLGISCINIGCYKEAAEHLLGGLSMHQVEGQKGLSYHQSTSLNETLKRAFIAMERRDLVELVKPGMDLDQFRGEFNF